MLEWGPCGSYRYLYGSEVVAMHCAMTPVRWVHRVRRAGTYMCRRTPPGSCGDSCDDSRADLLFRFIAQLPRQSLGLCPRPPRFKSFSREIAHGPSAINHPESSTANTQSRCLTLLPLPLQRPPRTSPTSSSMRSPVRWSPSPSSRRDRRRERPSARRYETRASDA